MRFRQDRHDGDRRVRRFDDLIWSALPGLHTIALSLSHVGGQPLWRALRALQRGHAQATSNSSCSNCSPGTPGVALTNAMAFEEVVRQRAHERAVIDGSADGIAVLDEDQPGQAVEPGRAPDTGHAPRPRSWARRRRSLPEPGERRTHKLESGRWLDVLCTAFGDGDERSSTSATSPQPRNWRRPRTCSSRRRAMNCAPPSPSCRGSPPPWRALGHFPIDRRSAVRTIADVRARSAGWSISCCSVRAPAPTSFRENGPFDLAAC